MDEPHMVELNDEEASILLDAINWYTDETDMSEHVEDQLDKCADTIEDDNLIDITDVEKSLIRGEVLQSFSDEIEDVVLGMSNPQAGYQFFGEQLESMSRKIREAGFEGGF